MGFHCITSITEVFKIYYLAFIYTSDYFVSCFTERDYAN